MASSLLMLCTNISNQLKLSKSLFPLRRLDKRTHRLQSSRNVVIYQLQKQCKAQQTCGITFPITTSKQTANPGGFKQLPATLKTASTTATTSFTNDISRGTSPDGDASKLQEIRPERPGRGDGNELDTSRQCRTIWGQRDISATPTTRGRQGSHD